MARRQYRSIPSLTENDLVRFMSGIDKDGPIPSHRQDLGPCWKWTKGRNNYGYGVFHFGKSSYLVNRVAMSVFFGVDPEGMLACHHCDNPICANPSHLFLGRHIDNTADMISKGRINPARGDASGSRRHPERLVRGATHWMRVRPKDVLRGDRSVNSLLTNEQVREIRELYEPNSRGENGSVSLARRFMVTHGCIMDAILGRTYTDIGGPVAKSSFTRTHCVNGHPRIPENMYDSGGYKICLECKRSNLRKTKEKAKMRALALRQKDG
jgi:hypothetical protein